jgi:prefoldin beta subunit
MDKEQLEKMSKDYGIIQEQLQSVAMQREQISAQKMDLDEALAEINRSSGKVYVAIGGVVVETGKDSALKDIKEKIESTEMRLGIAKRQYDELSKKEHALRSEITAALKPKGNA